MEFLLERKKNRQIKGLISNMWLILKYTVQLVIPDVVAEKSLTKKKFTDKHTNIMTEKAKIIYPLYTSYTGGIMNKNQGKIKGVYLYNYS